MKRDVKGRLNRMENMQKIHLDGVTYMMKYSGDEEKRKSAQGVFNYDKKNIFERDEYDKRLDQLFEFKSKSNNNNSQYNNNDTNAFQDKIKKDNYERFQKTGIIKNRIQRIFSEDYISKNTNSNKVETDKESKNKD